MSRLIMSETSVSKKKGNEIETQMQEGEGEEDGEDDEIEEEDPYADELTAAELAIDNATEEMYLEDVEAREAVEGAGFVVEDDEDGDDEDEDEIDHGFVTQQLNAQEDDNHIAMMKKGLDERMRQRRENLQQHQEDEMKMRDVPPSAASYFDKPPPKAIYDYHQKPQTPRNDNTRTDYSPSPSLDSFPSKPILGLKRNKTPPAPRQSSVPTKKATIPAQRKTYEEGQQFYADEKEEVIWTIRCLTWAPIEHGEDISHCRTCHFSTCVDEAGNPEVFLIPRYHSRGPMLMNLDLTIEIEKLNYTDPKTQAARIAYILSHENQDPAVPGRLLTSTAYYKTKSEAIEKAKKTKLSKQQSQLYKKYSEDDTYMKMIHNPIKSQITQMFAAYISMKSADEIMSQLNGFADAFIKIQKRSEKKHNTVELIMEDKQIDMICNVMFVMACMDKDLQLMLFQHIDQLKKEDERGRGGGGSGRGRGRGRGRG